MSALSIQPTFPIFTETDGLPLENGYIWIGTANLDPQGNPINVYWDAALTILAPQPIRTINGYPSRSGTPGRLYVNSDYSIRVQNSKGSLVYSASAATERYGNGVVTGVNAEDVIYNPPFTGAVQTNVEAKLAQTISAKDFGAVGNGIVDDTTAIQNALNAAINSTLVLAPGATYKITSGLTAYGSIEGNNATLMYYGSAISVLLYTNSAGDLQNFTIDGTNVASCERGLGVNTDFAQTGWNYYSLTVQNISNSNNTQPAEGASFYRFSGATQTTGFFDISINVFNVTATANGIIGDNGGAAVGLAFGCNGSGTDCNVLIHDCVIKNIAPDEDAIGIYLLTGDHTSASAKGWYVIQDCEVYNSEKYSYKLQAPNVMVRRCLADNLSAACSENFTCYGHNVIYQDCVVRNQQGEGFVSHGPGTVLLNGRVQGNSNFNAVRLYPTALRFRCNGLVIETTATFSAVGFTRLAIDNGDRADFDNVRISGSTNTGTAVSIIGVGKVTFSNMFVSGFQQGVEFPYGSVTTWFDTCEISVSGALSYGIYRLGNTANFIRIRDSRILSGFIGIFTSSSLGANSAIVDIDSTSINSGTHGILAPSNSRITNCVLQSAGTLGTGLGAENSVYRNNQITNFSTGIDISNTTTAEMSDNVTIGTTTPYLTTGFTAFVNVNNFSR